MEVDQALKQLGKFGRWQMMSYNLMGISFGIPTAFHMLSIVFLGGKPESFRCHLPPGADINTSIPWVVKDGLSVLDSCNMYENITQHNQTIPCNQGYHYATDFQSTIITDFNLVCHRGYLSSLSQSIFAVGVMVGAIVFTPISDRIGRKPPHLGCQFSMAVIGIGCAFVQDYSTFTVMRFLLGMLQQGVVMTCFVQMCELFASEMRTFAGIFLQIYWALGMMIMALIAYFIRDWRMLQIALSLPGLLVIGGLWLFPESIPWLVANNHLDRAKAELRKAEKWNKVTIPQKIMDGLVNSVATGTRQETPVANGRNENKTGRLQFWKKTSNNGGKERETLLTVMKHPKLRIYAVIMCLLWLTASLVYFGLSLSTSELAGNRYLNFFISGAVEVPAYAHSIFVLQRFGRRVPLCGYYIVAGVSLSITAFLPSVEKAAGVSLTPLIITLTMIGKFGITTCFGAVFLYGGEIYPTNVRNVGIGMASVAARIGGMLAPFSSYLAELVGWLPGIIFGILSIVVGLLTLVLPETVNRPLPQTIEDMEAWDKKREQQGEEMTTVIQSPGVEAMEGMKRQSLQVKVERPSSKSKEWRA